MNDTIINITKDFFIPETVNQAFITTEECGKKCLLHLNKAQTEYLILIIIGLALIQFSKYAKEEHQKEGIRNTGYLLIILTIGYMLLKIWL